MNKLTLFDLGQNYLSVLGKIEENQGELTPELEAELDLAIQEIITKTDGYIKVASEIEVAINQAKEFEQKFKSRRQSLENQLDNLKTRLIQHMKVTNMTEIVGELGKVKLMHSKAVNLLDDHLIPEKYITEKVVISISKTEIKKDIESGITVPGAELTETDYIRIF